MPCFMPDQAHQEGMIIGRLMTGYGELEVVMCRCLIAVEGMLDLPIRTLFKVRNANDRIEAARVALKQDYAKAGLQIALNETLDDMEWCRQVRNQYAHCQWYWTSHEGLCFVNLEQIAKQSRSILDLTKEKKSVGLNLLIEQEEFFFYVKQCFDHLGQSYIDWDRKHSPSALKRPILIGARPPKKPRPLLHN
jgi:hypothetical protein